MPHRTRQITVPKVAADLHRHYHYPPHAAYCAAHLHVRGTIPSITEEKAQAAIESVDKAFCVTEQREHIIRTVYEATGQATGAPPMYRISCTTVPNPDFGQTRPISPPQLFTAPAIAELRQQVYAYQSEWDIGGGNWPQPAVDQLIDGTWQTIGYMSYNGRVWSDQNWTEDTTEVFFPGEPLPPIIPADDDEEEDEEDEEEPRITRCIHCNAYINLAYGAVSPGIHADHAGTAADPRAPGDYNQICAVCNYGKGRSGKPGTVGRYGTA